MTARTAQALALVAIALILLVSVVGPMVRTASEGLHKATATEGEAR